MRQTNLQKWDDAQSSLDILKKKYIENFFIGKEIPKVIYQADMNQIEEIEIDHIGVSSRNEPYYYKKPTKEDIKLLLDFINNFDTQEKEIFVYYTKKSGTSTCSGAYKYSEVIENKRLSFNRDELIPVQQELNEKYAPREGYKPCAYCGRQVPENTMVSHKIIFQSSRPDPFSKTGYKRFVDEKVNKYCSNQCGGNDQMAHEG